MIVDSHVHMWQRSRTPQPWIDPETMRAIDRDFWVSDLEAEMGATGIDQAVLVQSANSAAETAQLLGVSQSRGILGVVGWIDLAADVPSQLDEIRHLPGGANLVGIRHLAHTDPDPMWLARHDVGTGLHALGAANLPFDLVISASQLRIATTVVAAHPEVVFVLDHLAKPPLRSGNLSQWKDDLAALAELPNVWSKLSGLAIETDWATWGVHDLEPVVELALEAFGPSRLMFGSDWPLVELTGGLSQWLQTAMTLTSHSDSQAIFASNALGVYGKVSN